MKCVLVCIGNSNLCQRRTLTYHYSFTASKRAHVLVHIQSIISDIDSFTPYTKFMERYFREQANRIDLIRSDRRKVYGTNFFKH